MERGGTGGGLEEDQRGDAEDVVAAVTPDGTNRKWERKMM